MICLIPIEKDLIIRVMDYDMLTRDDGIVAFKNSKPQIQHHKRRQGVTYGTSQHPRRPPKCKNCCKNDFISDDYF